MKTSTPALAPTELAALYTELAAPDPTAAFEEFALPTAVGLELSDDVLGTLYEITRLGQPLLESYLPVSITSPTSPGSIC